MPAGDLEERVRAICMEMPGVTERLSHGSPGFFAGRQFVMLWPAGHHDHDFPHLWCAAPPGAQETLLEAAPDRFFRPPYVGSRGWLGLRLDGLVDWAEVEVVCEDAFRAVAPRKLLAQLERGRSEPPLHGRQLGSQLLSMIMASSSPPVMKQPSAPAW